MDASLPGIILESLPVAVYAIKNNRFVYVNARFAEALGYTREEIEALGSVTEVVAEDQREMVAEMLRRRAAGSDCDVRYFTTVRCRDGTLLDAEIHGSVADPDSDGPLVLGAAIDVTAHLASSLKLIEREEYFRALTENISDVIAILDWSGTVTYINPSVNRILGCQWTELINTSLFDRVHPDDREQLSSAVHNLASGSSLGPAEYRIRHENGSWRVMDLVGTNLLRHRTVQGLVLNMRDVTERKRMEAEVEQLHRLTSLGRLAAQVAHEFNNVLMGVQSMVHVLRRRGANNPDVVHAIEGITASLGRGKQITTDILRFTRPAQLTRRAVPAAQIVHQAVEELRAILPADIRIELDLSETPLVSADPNQLSQVLINLALNARDAMPRGGMLTIGTGVTTVGQLDAEDPFVHFTVSDTGEGIASENLPYIFQPLFTTKKSGTGIGLSVVYQIVTAHGGHISVQSEPGKGTTFDIFIPAAKEPAREEPMAARPEERTPLKILIVEDDEVIAAGLRESLQAEGLRVETVNRGRDAGAAVEAFRPDVLVLDLSLPDADGREVYAQISQRRHLPVVFSTGHATESAIHEMLRSSGTAFLMKPYSPSELLQAIWQLLRQKETS